LEIATRKAYKYRIYPTKSQVSNLNNQFSMCRHLFNWSIIERTEQYQNNNKSVNYYDQANNLPALKESKPWFNSIHSQVLQDVLKRVDKAFQAFFRRVKAGEEPGYPNLKKRGDYDSITYPQYNSKPENNLLKISKFNLPIKIQYHREIEGNVKTLSIVKEGTKWFAVFSSELSISVEPKCLQNPVGIDLGLIDFYYDSNGNNVKVPKFYRENEKKLKKLQRNLSKLKKRTKEYLKTLYIIRNLHYRIRCKRENFFHHTVNELLQKHDIVCIEKLDISNMAKRPEKIEYAEGVYLPNGAEVKSRLNKSIYDAAWGKFISILKYKAANLGKSILE
jgi:putative transposase